MSTLQLTFTCSNSTIETLEKGVKYVQSLQLNNQNDVIEVVLVFLLLTLKQMVFLLYGLLI